MARHILLVMGVVTLCATVAPQALAIANCSEIGCYPYPGCQVTILWGQCLNDDQQWACQWYACTDPDDNYTMPWQWCHGCGSGGGGCFLKGTPIAMADGTAKAIEAVQVGDWVMGYDVSTGHRTRPQVLQVHPPRVVDHYFIINETTRVSATQPVLSRGAWINASELEMGGRLTSPSGNTTPIFSIRRIDEQATTHNLQVSDGVYVADGIVVHNKDLVWYYHP